MMTYDYSSDTYTGQWNGNTVVVDAGVFHKALKQLQLAGRPYREAFDYLNNVNYWAWLGIEGVRTDKEGEA